MVNFPFICSNISAAPEDGIYIYQLIRKYNFELSCVHDHDSLFYLEGYTDTPLINTTEGKIKSRQARETGKIGYTRYKTKTNKPKNTTQYVLDIVRHCHDFTMHGLAV